MTPASTFVNNLFLTIVSSDIIIIIIIIIISLDYITIMIDLEIQ